MELNSIPAGVLEVACQVHGPANGADVVLLHGFPYDVHAYAEVAAHLARADCRVYVPYLRGYGPTRFINPGTPRSGQQAALAHDLLALLDALAIDSAVLAGYDWGGRAACIVAALWPERARGLVSGNGYNLHDIPGAAEPRSPEAEHRYWYQYYFHGERGRRGLACDRRAFCRTLWRLWSPHWDFDEPTFERSAAAFDNPDFVDVVIHSYRHRYGLVPGDPAFEDTERRLTARPDIRVPSVVLDGEGDGVMHPGGAAGDARHFTGRYAYRALPRIGHNIAQEAPREFADAVLSLL